MELIKAFFNQTTEIKLVGTAIIEINNARLR